MRWFSKALALSLFLALTSASAQTLGPPGAGGTSTIIGGTCTNQVVTALSTNGTPTCAGVPVAALNLSQITNSLTGTVALNNIANYFDGPSIAQGTTGTWFASGNVSISSGGLGDSISCKLWDGTTVIDSYAVDVPVAVFTVGLALSGFITSPAGNIRISCRDPNSTTAIIQFNKTGNSKDATVSAFRLQ